MTKLSDRIPDVDVPEGVSGNWRVERFEISESDSSYSMLSLMNHGRGFIRPGTYTRMLRGETLVMSDTPDEKRDHYGPVLEARREGGRVLVAGLGIGMVANAILQLENVEHVTVIEQSPDVIALAAPHYQERYGDRLEIIEADVFAWKPPKGAKWSVAWFDIWDTICEENLEGMTKLKRKFARRAAWKGCWCEERLRHRRRQHRAGGW